MLQTTGHFLKGGYSDEQAYAIGFANMHHESFINGMRVEYAMEQYGNAHGGASAFSIFLRKKVFLLSTCIGYSGLLTLKGMERVLFGYVSHTIV